MSSSAPQAKLNLNFSEGLITCRGELKGVVVGWVGAGVEVPEWSEQCAWESPVAVHRRSVARVRGCSRC